MNKPGPMREREVDLVVYARDLALDEASDRFMDAWEEIMIDRNDLPWWAFIRRAKLDAEADACMRLFHVFNFYTVYGEEVEPQSPFDQVGA